MENNVTLKPKITLKRKGDSADVASFTKMKVELSWKLQKVKNSEELGPDFDLMAFYKAKDGREGGICSEFYNNNSVDMGYIDKFPFMQLDKDDKADDSSKEGDEANELLKISKLDDFDEVFICVINYDDAVENIQEVFGKYNGFVTVQSDGGDNFEVPLDSKETGHVAVICKIVSHNGKPRLINVNDTISLSKFASTMPGASLIINS